MTQKAGDRHGELRAALGREVEAAGKVAETLSAARRSVETRDAPEYRRLLSEAAADFDALLRAAAQRNALVTAEARALGLPRAATLSDVIGVLGEGAASLRAQAADLRGELGRVRREVRAHGLIARYGSAQVSNLMQLSGHRRVAPAYGSRGQRTAAASRAARTA